MIAAASAGFTRASKGINDPSRNSEIVLRVRRPPKDIVLRQNVVRRAAHGPVLRNGPLDSASEGPRETIL